MEERATRRMCVTSILRVMGDPVPSRVFSFRARGCSKVRATFSRTATSSKLPRRDRISLLDGVR